MDEIEVFEYLQQKTSIKGINIDDLKSLLTDCTRGKTYKQYTIKMINNGSILIHDSNTNNNILLKCIKHYYDTKQISCERIRKELISYNANYDNQETSTPSCSNCFLNYIDMLKNGKI